MVHPRDHILVLSFQARSDMTDPTKVSCKVRVNGGAATTYTSVTSPAVAQAQDCAFSYHLELPADSFADGDRVSRTWLYNGVAYAYGDTIIGPSSADAAATVWENGTRTLSSFGTLVADLAAAVWGAAVRTLSSSPRAED